VVGLNLGKGTDTPLESAAEDYLTVLRACYERVDYFSINVSSPNTANLRELGHGEALRSLSALLVDASSRESERRGLARRPLWLKVSPDQSDDLLKEVADVAAETGLDGIIATNTTSARIGRYAAVDPQGGLSGQALQQQSCRLVTLLRERQGPGFPLIGVGGVLDAASALAMRAAGADLVQIYTGFVYGGPGLPRRLAWAMKERR
jgi:dihydroorotate dehydrogenase